MLQLESELNLEEYFGSFGYNFNPGEYEFKKVYDNMQLFGYPQMPYSLRLSTTYYLSSAADFGRVQRSGTL